MNPQDNIETGKLMKGIVLMLQLKCLNNILLSVCQAYCIITLRSLPVLSFFFFLSGNSGEREAFHGSFTPHCRPDSSTFGSYLYGRDQAQWHWDHQGCTWCWVCVLAGKKHVLQRIELRTLCVQSILELSSWPKPIYL